MADHECPKEGCERRVPFQKLACPAHWALVTYPTQRAVYAAWRNRMRDPMGHVEAMANAITEMNR